MARRKRKFSWPALREWLNAGAAVGAFLLGIVALWVTAQISGLEDYFRSEIGRRNTELNALSERAARQELLAEARADQLTQLHTSTEAMIALSLRAHQRLIQSESQLATVRSETLAARQDLSDARSETASMRANYATQAREFDLLKRQQAYQHAALTVTFARISSDQDERSRGLVSTSSAIISAIRNMQMPSHTAGLGPYIQRIKDRFERQCPDLLTSQEVDPPRPRPPPRPTISYPRGTSQARIAQLTREALERWNAEYSEYSRLDQQYTMARFDERQRLVDRARTCICSSLSDDQFSAQDICQFT